jgi:hypothetical protein
MNIRNLQPGEAIPPGLDTGFEKLRMMPDWVWIAENYGVPIGALIGAPCHQLAHLVRLCVRDDQHKTIVSGLLLRAFLRDVQKRGYLVYFAWLDPTNEIERRLVGLIRKSGGKQETMPQVSCLGLVSDAARY